MPKNLEYLKPFQKFLAKLPKSRIGDTVDTALLEKLVRGRIQGMSEEEARNQLISDLEELQTYLSPPSRKNDRLHFVIGFLLVAAEKPEKLLKLPVEPKKVLERLLMELPPKAKSSCDQYTLTVNWKRQRFYAGWLKLEEDFAREQILKQLSATEPTLDGRLASRVDFGEVTGNKCVLAGDFPAVHKRVDYLLEVPGGYVRVLIQASNLFDETEWESYLATLRFAIPQAI